MRIAGVSAAKFAAYCAVFCALLIAVQVAFSFLSGVELVTVLLLAFCTCFPLAYSLTVAISFSLLRCLIWGFYPNIIALYLVYYTLFSASFCLIGKVSASPTLLKLLCVNLLLAILGGTALVFGVLDIVKVSRIYAETVRVLLYVVAGGCIGLLIAFDALFVLVKKGRVKSGVLKLFLLCAAACAFTVFFTLLDDVITPLYYGMGRESALAYFYSSFLAMLPQVICCAVSVALLYYPLTFAMGRVAPKGRKCIDKGGKK